jgi:hypothetical protein
MSDRVAASLLQQFRQSSSPGGTKLTHWRELRRLFTELTKEEGDKPRGKVSREGHDMLLGLGAADVVDSALDDLLRYQSQTS